MASKLLNVRMDEEMIKGLKEACEELGINVTDAIKSFSKDFIENKKLPSEKEIDMKKDEEKLEDIDNKEFFEEIEEMHEIGGKKNIKEFEKMNEDISNVIWDYYKKLRKFIRDLDDFTLIHSSYNEISEKFKKEKKEFLDEKITDIMLEFCKIEYEENLSYLEENQKFEESKYTSIMKTIEKENPELYKEIFEKYGYDIKREDIWYLGCKNYEEAKEKLNEILTPKEIKLFVDYSRGTDNCKTEDSSKEFMTEIEKREKEEGVELTDIYNKLNPIKISSKPVSFKYEPPYCTYEPEHFAITPEQYFVNEDGELETIPEKIEVIPEKFTYIPEKIEIISEETDESDFDIEKESKELDLNIEKKGEEKND